MEAVYRALREQCTAYGATLIAVSKRQSAAGIQTLYDRGHRDFGENYVQELCEKRLLLPSDIRWHFIGHLQRNKVKYIAPFIASIQSVDTEALLGEIQNQARKYQRIIPVLLQVHIAREAQKFGFNREDEAVLKQLIHTNPDYSNVKVQGLMGMATFTEDSAQIRAEYRDLKALWMRLNEDNNNLTVLSMGMSGDFEIALAEGATMVRLGSLLFGARPKS